MRLRDLKIKNVVPIFYACDNRFARYTLISITSLIENASEDYRYHIYILSTDIEKQYIDYAAGMRRKNVIVEFVDMKDTLEQISDKLPIRDYYSKTTYYRLFIPVMYPKYRRAIYIDSDTVVTGDISELFRTQIGRNYAAACPDQPVNQVEIFADYAEQVLGIKPKNYFNAGVMLINCRQFRENHLLEAFFDLLNVYTFVVAQDQDYLNLICKDHVYYLEPKWNAQVFGEMKCKEKEFGILHFNMASKPWNYPDFRYASYFWKYAKMTPFYESITYDMETYTDEQRQRDNLSGESLINMAVSEINSEQNYFRMMSAQDGRSEDRKQILEKIAQYEKEGRFSEDVEDDPPAPVLMPEDIDYLHNNITSKMQTKYAFKMARWFVNLLIRKKQLIIKEITGEEYLRELKKNKVGAVITCNHFNAYDSFAIQFAFEAAGVKRRKMYRVIREGNYTGFPGFYGFLMRHCDTLPLSSNRDTMKKFMSAVDTILQKGDYVLVYPEQSMWWNYRKPKPLQKGAFTFAAKNQKPVVPVFITMSDSPIIDKDGFHVQEYSIHICPPIYPDPEKRQADNVNEMKEKNYEVWKNVYEETYGIPLSYTCDEDSAK
jgi:lipopolysaccharide biosynthesis glycosyltransferase